MPLLSLPYPPLTPSSIVEVKERAEINVGGKTRWEDPYFTAAFKHGSSHGGCNVNGPKVAKFLDG